MKKLLLALVIWFGFSFKTAACSCYFLPFCHTLHSIPHDLVVSGVITYLNPSDTLQMRMRILQTFKGQETNDTITIWAGTGFDCNGWMSMAFNEHTFYPTAHQGDTVIMMLPRITASTIVNPWDVVGDYRRPTWFCYTTALTVKNDTVQGLIYGPSSSTPYWYINSLPYPEFLSSWTGEEFACRQQVGIEKDLKNKYNLVVSPNPASGKVNITLPSDAPFFGPGSLQIRDITGRLVRSQSFTSTGEELVVNDFAPGMYMINVTDLFGNTFQQKLIIRN